jgi:hypothetical protein
MLDVGCWELWTCDGVHSIVLTYTVDFKFGLIPRPSSLILYYLGDLLYNQINIYQIIVSLTIIINFASFEGKIPTVLYTKHKATCSMTQLYNKNTTIYEHVRNKLCVQYENTIGWDIGKRVHSLHWHSPSHSYSLIDSYSLVEAQSVKIKIIWYPQKLIVTSPGRRNNTSAAYNACRHHDERMV